MREIHKTDTAITVTRKYSSVVKEVRKKFRKVKSGKQVIGREVKEVVVLVSNKTIEVDMKGRTRKAVRNQEVEQHTVKSILDARNHRQQQQAGRHENLRDWFQRVNQQVSTFQKQQQAVRSKDFRVSNQEVEQQAVGSRKLGVRNQAVKSILKVRNDEGEQQAVRRKNLRVRFQGVEQQTIERRNLVIRNQAVKSTVSTRREYPINLITIILVLAIIAILRFAFVYLMVR